MNRRTCGPTILNVIATYMLCAVAASGAWISCARASAISPDGVWDAIQSADPVAMQALEPLKSYELYQVDTARLNEILARAQAHVPGVKAPSEIFLALPVKNGAYAQFRIERARIFSEELEALNPGIQSFMGQGVDDPMLTARFVSTPSGFFAFIRTLDGMVFVEPLGHGNTRQCVLYTRADLADGEPFECRSTEEASLEHSGEPRTHSGDTDIGMLAVPSGPVLSTYRLAVSATGEFTTYFDPNGGRTNTLSQIAASVAAVNAIYVPEVAIQFVVVCANVFEDPDIDDFVLADDSLTSVIANQYSIDTNCGGSSAYDIGHVFHRTTSGFSGLGLGRACAINKAQGYSSVDFPFSGYLLWIVDLLSHEIGHQFSAQHTFNSDDGDCFLARSVTSAYELGSGSTIMAYAAGTRCEYDIPGTNDQYFHGHSYDQIVSHRDGSGGCGAQSQTGNAAPVVSAGPDYTIPRGTAFTLTASASDIDGDPLTYCWEQFDLGSLGSDAASNADGPLFRSRPPTLSPSRTLPQLSDIVDGIETPTELLPTVDRSLRFRCTVRDNQVSGGGVNSDEMVVTVSGAPFALTYPNGGETIGVGHPVAITWTVGGGSVAPLVNILYSGDGGSTFTPIATGVSNDGSHSVILPDVVNSHARLMVQAVGNIFFDVSDADFALTDTAPPSIYDVSIGGQSVSERSSINRLTHAYNEIRAFGSDNIAVNRLEIVINNSLMAAEGPFTPGEIIDVNYPWNTSQLAPGIYACEVRALDSSGNATSYPFTVVLESGSMAGLTLGKITPWSGTTTTSFGFDVTFTDPSGRNPDGNAVYANIDGVDHAMSWVAGAPEDGSLYTYSRGNFNTGAHQVHFHAISQGFSLRYPQLGADSISFTVNQSTAGWEADAPALRLTPSMVPAGGTFTASGDIHSNVNSPDKVYYALPYRFDLYSQTGSLIESRSGSVPQLTQGQTVAVSGGTFSVPAGSTGQLTMVFSIQPTLDTNFANNAVSGTVVVGEAADTEIWVMHDDYVDVVLDATTPTQTFNGATYRLTYVSGSSIDIKRNSEAPQHIPQYDYKLYASRNDLVKCEWTNTIPLMAGVSFGALAPAGDAAFDRGTLRIGAGQSGSFSITSASARYTFGSSAPDFLPKLSGPTVSGWYTGLVRSNNNRTATYNFSVPQGVPVGTYDFVIEGALSGDYTKFLSKLSIQVVQAAPTISSLSRTSISADDAIAIHGANFGTTGSVTFGGLPAASVVAWAANRIDCVVPNGVASGNVVVATSAGVSNPMPYTVISATGDPVVVTTVPPQVMPASSMLMVARLVDLFSDPNGDPLTFTESIDGPGISVDQAAWATGWVKLVSGPCTPIHAVVTLQATDPSGGFVTQSFAVDATTGGDVTAPAAPGPLAVVPADWSRVPNFAVSWVAPPEQSGLVAVRYKLGATPQSATDGERVTSTPINVEVASAGVTDIYIWGEDACGNVDETRAATASLRYDDEVPVCTLTISNGSVNTHSVIVSLSLTASDIVSGMGIGASMSFSNDNATWSDWEPFAEARASWNLSEYGGSALAGVHVVWAQVRDVAGNVSAVVADDIVLEPAVTVCEIVPAMLNWSVPDGNLTLRTQQVTITNSGTTALEGSPVASYNGYQFEPTSFVVPTGGSQLVTVSYSPTGCRGDSGTHLDTIDFGTGCDAYPSYVLDDDFFLMTVSQDTVHFYVDTPGDTDSRTIVISNAACGNAGMFIPPSAEFYATDSSFMVDHVGDHVVELNYAPVDDGDDVHTMLIRVDMTTSMGLPLGFNITCIGHGPSSIEMCRDLQSYVPPGCVPDPAVLNTDVTVEGVVYLAPGSYGGEVPTGGYLQDATGGINFWRSPPPAGIEVGDRIRVTGPLWDYLGEIHIGTYTYETIATNQDTPPVDLSIRALVSDCSNAGSHVRIYGVVANSGVNSFTLVDGSDSIEVRRAIANAVDFSPISNGETWGVDGVCFKEGENLYMKPVDQSHLIPPSSPPCGDWCDVIAGTTALPGYSVAIAWSDFDNDGDDDAYVVRQTDTNPNVLLVNDGTGNLTECTPAALADTSSGTHAAWGDYDNDGLPDLFLTNYTGENKLYHNDGPGVGCWSFTPVPLGEHAYPGQSIACAWLDIDHDGNLEVYVSNRDGSNQLLRILPQIEDITPAGLQYATATQGFAWGDVDLDMDPDLYIVVEGSEHALFEQQSDNSFLPIGMLSPTGGQGASWGDFDNDGDLDLYVTHWGPGNRLLRNDGQGNFARVASPVLENTAWGQSADWGDYDNDGYLDLYLANYATANVLLHNEGGTGTFTAVPDSVLGGDGASIGAAWSDIDDDGDLDLYVCNSGQPDVLARNNLNDVGNWLKIRLHGYRGPELALSSRRATGAIVFAIAGQDTFMRQVGGGSGYASQQSDIIHIGLGDHTVVDRLVVIWPSELPNGAHHQTVDETGVMAGQTLDVYEPDYDPSDVPPAAMASNVVLHPAQPNPFNPMTLIAYELPSTSRVRLVVYDLNGRRVRTLRSGETETAGRHEVVWQGRDDSGHLVAAGVYVCRLEAGGAVLARRMTLVK